MLVEIADIIMISYAGEAEISGVALVDMVSYLIIMMVVILRRNNEIYVTWRGIY